MSVYVLDASALLALMNGECGSGRVEEAVEAGAAISLVNVAEVVAKLSELGMPKEVVREALDVLGMETVAFDTAQAYKTGLLRPVTRHIGLSLGDRACLSLAIQLEQPVLTADRAWKSLNLGIDIQVIR